MCIVANVDTLGFLTSFTHSTVSVTKKCIPISIKISPSKANVSSNIVNCVPLKPCIKL